MGGAKKPLVISELGARTAADSGCGQRLRMGNGC